MKNNYYRILGLEEGADEKEIKKAYRKLALRYHPDRNKSEQASKMFILINEAYGILLRTPQRENRKENNKEGKQYEYETFERRKPQKTKEELYKERLHRARKRFEYLKKKEEEENEQYYQNISSGLNWQLFKYVVGISLFLSLILSLDYLVLPSRFEKDSAQSGNRLLSYSGFYHRKIVPLKTNNGDKMWVSALTYSTIESHQEIILEKTFFFRDIKSIHFWRRGEWVNDKVDFSVTGSFPLIPIILILPIITYILKGRTLTYSLLFNLSIYIYSCILLILLYSNDRWAHIITLGFL